MGTSIQMGNDEFILYIRKNHKDCTTSNDELGKSIWKWINENDTTAVKVYNGEVRQCYWGKTGEHISDTELPYSARQFRFDSTLLPSLYKHLDELGSE